MGEWKISIVWVRVAEAMASETKKRTESLRRNEWMSRVHWNQWYFPAFDWSRGAPMNVSRAVNFMQRSLVFFYSSILARCCHCGIWAVPSPCQHLAYGCCQCKTDVSLVRSSTKHVAHVRSTKTHKNCVPCPTITPPSPPFTIPASA